MHQVFIDGQAGTTGLAIHSLLKDRVDIELLEIAESDRKDNEKKRQLIAAADLLILCLPDTAAIETVSLAHGTEAKILDASTAHRTHADWVYGLPELNEYQREKIRSAQYVSNPGCYPTGFLLALAPLVASGLVSKESQITVNAISGYSGGGRQLIEKYQQRQSDDTKKKRAEITSSWAARPYALHLAHKHVPEMRVHSGLTHAPLFVPSVGDFRQGMLVQVGLFNGQLAIHQGSHTDAASLIHELWQGRYHDEVRVSIFEPNPVDQLDGGYLDPEFCNGTNQVELFIFGSDEHSLLVARLDNLGKGAAGAAVQNLNIMLGCDEQTGNSLQTDNIR